MKRAGSSHAVDLLASTAGDAAHWERVWASKRTEPDQLFTRERPRSLRQLWQRCYAEDLIRLVDGAHLGRDCCELGSGRGTTSMYLADMGYAVTMVDLAPSAFEVARRNFAECEVPLPKMVCADAQDTGLPANSFDFVYNIGVLEHFEDPLPFLNESVRLLRPRGLGFMVIVPDASRLMGWLQRSLLNPLRMARLSAAALLKGRYPQDNGETVRTRHRGAFYERIAREAGAKAVRCVPYNAYVGLYGSRWLEERITIPLYAAHNRIVGRLGGRELRLETRRSLSLCDLLLFTAP